MTKPRSERERAELPFSQNMLARFLIDLATEAPMFLETRKTAKWYAARIMSKLNILIADRVEAARREERKRTLEECAKLAESESREYDQSSRNLDAAGYTIGGGFDAAGAAACKSLVAKIQALAEEP